MSDQSQIRKSVMKMNFAWTLRPYLFINLDNNHGTVAVVVSRIRIPFLKKLDQYRKTRTVMTPHSLLSWMPFNSLPFRGCRDMD